MLARVVFDYPLIGRAAGSGLFDMSPFERGEERVRTDGGFERVRPATEPWLPHQHRWSGVAAIGSPVVTLLTAGAFGVLRGLFGEVTQRIFYSHSGTHVDPPAMAIVLVMLLLGVLFLVGVIPNAGCLSL